MSRLLASEIRRLASRRLVKWMLLVSIFLVLLLVVIVAVTHDPDARDLRDAMTLTELWLTKAAAAQLGVNRDNAIATISVLTYLLVIVIGASAVGAEYRAGTVGTILTWEPRRIRLLVARLVAAAVVGMAFFLLVHLVFVGAWAIGVELTGRTGADREQLLGRSLRRRRPGDADRRSARDHQRRHRDPGQEHGCGDGGLVRVPDRGRGHPAEPGGSSSFPGS